MSREIEEMPFTYEKPPLGVKPAWLFAEERINDLLGALERAIHSPSDKNYDNVKKYAKEIYLQADLIKQMNEREE